MNEVIPGLWVGNWHDARDSNGYFVVTVAVDSPFKGDAFFPIIDGPGNEDSDYINAVQCVVDSYGQKPILVHCMAGRSRSVAVIAGALMKIEDLNWIAAYQKVLEAREETRMHPVFADLLRKVDA